MKELREQDKWGLGKPKVMIFDVNETLIDFQSLNPLFKKTFGDEKVLREWLGHLILYSMTLTMSGLYRDYWNIGRGVFRMVGGIHNIDVTDDDVEALKKGMQTMPACSSAYSRSRCTLLVSIAGLISSETTSLGPWKAMRSRVG